MTTEMKRTVTCGSCQVSGHNARTCANVTKESVLAAFTIGGFTMNERYEECGFVYFPASRPWTGSARARCRA